jgi:hypothetical protein
MYYAQCNSYASETNTGFANTWIVISFDSRADRDAFVEQDCRLGTESITLAKARKMSSRYQRYLADNGGYLAVQHLLPTEEGRWVPAF